MSVELLRAELDVLWGFDERGRLLGPDDLVLAVAPDGVFAAVSDRMPDGLAGHVERNLRTLEEEWTTDSAWPSYLVSPPLAYDCAAVPLRSDDPSDVRKVRGMRPGNWEPEEWEELVGGGAGAPWTMIVEDGRVVSICHTPRRTSAGAEAGTWTASDYRGRGYAAATTAVWADLLPGVTLFYSTSAGNRSSQRVAERLGLRPLGRLWKLSRKASR